MNAPDYADESLWRSLNIYDHDEQQKSTIGDKAWTWYQKAGGPKRQPSYWRNARFGALRHLFPVVGVTWYEAAAYAAWFSRHWGTFVTNPVGPRAIGFRLPLESEWATAGGGEQGERYPWQGTPLAVADTVTAHANTSEAGLEGTTPVFLYLAGMSVRGIADMSGNVWEWQANWFDNKNHLVALRGGAWTDAEKQARVAARGWNPPTRAWSRDFGFRVLGVETDS